MIEVIEEVFKKHGFEFVETSLIELEEVAKYGTEKFLKFEKNGATFSVREDFTPQVAHLLRKTKEKKKVWYKGYVFREVGGTWKEIFQIGCDIVPADLKTCLDVLSDICSKIFEEDFQVVVGDFEKYDNLDEEIYQKNFEKIVEKKEVSKSLVFPSLKVPISSRTQVFKKYFKNVIFAPAFRKPRSYYSGIYFSVFFKERKVISGGEWFIYKRGIGFSVDLTALQEILKF